MRIISICPSNTELLAYLGAIDQLVGVDDYSDWPQSVNQLPKLGPDLSIDMDKLEQLNPDLVLASLSVPGMERNISKLKKRDIPYLVFNPSSLADIGNDLLTLGEHIGIEQKAEKIAGKYTAFIQKYREIANEIKRRPSLYWEWWPKPIFTPGQSNWLTEISELAGARNIFSDYAEASVQTDWAEVVHRKPEHICMVWVGVAQEKMNPTLIEKRQDASSLTAVTEKRIYPLDEPLFCRPSPRLLIGLKKIAAIIHPNKFPPFDNKDPLLK
jgi:iron complex transport system substrate-binding protein